MSEKIDRTALSQMVQIIVYPKGGTSEVTYLGGGRIVINSTDGVHKVTVAMPGYHHKTKRADLIIEKQNQAEVSR